MHFHNLIDSKNSNIIIDIRNNDINKDIQRLHLDVHA